MTNRGFLSECTAKARQVLYKCVYKTLISGYMYSKSTAGVVQMCVQNVDSRVYVQQKYSGALQLYVQIAD